MSTRLGALALSVIAFSTGSAQKSGTQLPASFPPDVESQLKIENEVKAGWTKSSMTPAAMARKADTFMNRLSGASGHTRYLYENPRGFGYSVGDFMVESPKRFYIEYAKLLEQRLSIIKAAKVVSDGKHVQAWTVDDFGPIMPVGASRLPAHPFKVWAVQNPQILFSAVGTKDKPISAVVAGAEASGYKARAEHRVFLTNGQPFSQDRIFIWKPGAKGPDTYECEIIVDPQTGAPVTIRVTRGEGRQHIRSMWACQWNLEPHQQFDASKIHLPVHHDAVKVG